MWKPCFSCENEPETASEREKKELLAAKFNRNLFSFFGCTLNTSAHTTHSHTQLALEQSVKLWQRATRKFATTTFKRKRSTAINWLHSEVRPCRMPVSVCVCVFSWSRRISVGRKCVNLFRKYKILSDSLVNHRDKWHFRSAFSVHFLGITKEWSGFSILLSWSSVDHSVATNFT